MKYIIKNNGPLKGHVTIGGAKNSALALIAATLLTNETVVLNNVPNISDINNMLEVVKALGGDVNFENNVLTVTNSSINPDLVIDYDYISRIRASYYFLGGLLGKYKKAIVAMPGGCQIGTRPIDLHLKGFELLGASCKLDDGNVIVDAETLKGNSIYLDFPSVGATINILLSCVLAEGTTVIKNAAREPHIVDLCNMLLGMGAKIRGAGTSTITVEGVEKLHSVNHTVIPDQIEAGTFMIAAAMTKGDVYVDNVIPSHLNCVTLKLREMGATVDIFETSVRVRADKKLMANIIRTAPYPGFPTDLQPQMAVALGISEGVSFVDEKIFDSRFMYVDELARMGAVMKVSLNANIVYGIENYKGATVFAPDLRAGAALVLAGLCATGKTTVKDIEYIKRGYENFAEKLRDLGANIREVS